jgi:hypothetical protein
MSGDTVVGLAVLFAIVVSVLSVVYGFRRASQGYYDDYGRKIPLDELKEQGKTQEAELATLKERLETEQQHSGDVLQRLEQLEKRIEKLEKRGSE